MHKIKNIQWLPVKFRMPELDEWVLIMDVHDVTEKNKRSFNIYMAKLVQKQSSNTLDTYREWVVHNDHKIWGQVKYWVPLNIPECDLRGDNVGFNT